MNIFFYLLVGWLWNKCIALLDWNIILKVDTHIILKVDTGDAPCLMSLSS